LSINNAVFLFVDLFTVVKVIPNQTSHFLPTKVLAKLILRKFYNTALAVLHVINKHHAVKI